MMFVRLFEEISGEGRWYRRRRADFEQRTPRSVDVLAEQLHLSPKELVNWDAVRHAVGQSVGVPAETLLPGDSMSVFWQMQLCGPDPVDVVLRLEQQLDCKVNCSLRDGELYAARTLDEFARHVIRQFPGPAPDDQDSD